ncbi:MAG TPA: hypothetical protein VMS17_19710 [Gemmataceae bacterium]|nr:hypothetical protein [Gemmataceae bacterium]
MTPTARTLQLLRAEGYLAVVAEAWLPGVNRRRDLFGFADVAAVHPHAAGPLLVQTTTADHLAHRRKKVQASPAARLWLRAGGRIELHGWQKRNGRWTVRRVELHGADLAPADLTPRPRRRGRPERGLFDGTAEAPRVPSAVGDVAPFAPPRTERKTGP